MYVRSYKRTNERANGRNKGRMSMQGSQQKDLEVVRVWKEANTGRKEEKITVVMTTPQQRNTYMNE